MSNFVRHVGDLFFDWRYLQHRLKPYLLPKPQIGQTHYTNNKITAVLGCDGKASL